MTMVVGTTINDLSFFGGGGALEERDCIYIPDGKKQRQENRTTVTINITDRYFIMLSTDYCTLRMKEKLSNPCPLCSTHRFPCRNSHGFLDGYNS
jgi:hypothetical protein